MKTKSFVLKPFCYGLAVEKYQNGLFLSFVDPCLSEEEKSSLSFSQEWDLPTQERRKKKNAPTQKLSKNSWRRSQKIIKNDKEEKEFIKYYWEKQNQAIWISHLTQQSFINSPTTLIYGRWVEFLEIELALKYGLSRINSL